MLNSLVDQGTPLLLTFLNKKYMVYIDESISWERINFAHGDMDKSLFQGKLKIVIKEEVML